MPITDSTLERIELALSQAEDALAVAESNRQWEQARITAALEVVRDTLQALNPHWVPFSMQKRQGTQTAEAKS